MRGVFGVIERGLTPRSRPRAMRFFKRHVNTSLMVSITLTRLTGLQLHSFVSSLGFVGRGHAARLARFTHGAGDETRSLTLAQIIGVARDHRPRGAMLVLITFLVLYTQHILTFKSLNYLLDWFL